MRGSWVRLRREKEVADKFLNMREVWEGKENELEEVCINEEDVKEEVKEEEKDEERK